MKGLLVTLFIALLAATGASGQFYTVAHTSGIASYGPTSVAVAGAGTAGTFPAWCGAGPYWIGTGTLTSPTPGSYTFTFARQVNAVKVFVTAADEGESIRLTINGIPLALTADHVKEWAGTCGAPFMHRDGDSMVSDAGNAAGEIDVFYPGITSVKVSTNGVNSGCVMKFQFSVVSAFASYPCEGDTLKLKVVGDSLGARYKWTGPGGFSSTLQQPFIYPCTMADTGNYSVVRITGSGSDTAQTHISIHPRPDAGLTVNDPLCSGMVDTVFFGAAAGPDTVWYQWSGPNTFSSTLRNPYITPVATRDTGTYFAVLRDRYGCRDTGEINVRILPVPRPPIIAGRTHYCTGDMFVPFFIVGATGIIKWYTVGTGGVGSSIPPVVSTTLPGITTVWATQTIGGCESRRSPIVITVVNTPPPPIVTGRGNYCQHEAYIAPAASGTDIKWYTTVAGGTGSLTTPTVNTSIAAVRTLYVSQTVTGCESGRTPFTIVVAPRPAPPVIINTPGNYCAGQPFVPFTIASGTDVLWYTGGSGGMGSTILPVLSTAATGAQTVWATQTVMGCESTRTPITISVYEQVSAAMTHIMNFGCHGDTAVFSNYSDNALDYTWYFGDGETSTALLPVHVYNVQGIQEVVLVARNPGCTDTARETIVINHEVHASFYTDKDIICQGSAVNIHQMSSGNSLDYFWSFGDGGTYSAADPGPHSYTRAGAYLLYVTVTDNIPCSDTMYRMIYVDSINSLELSASATSVCPGAPVSITGMGIVGGNTGIEWDFGDGGTVINRNPARHAWLTAGLYTITAKALYRACPDASATQQIVVKPVPVLNLGRDTTICAGSEPVFLKDKINVGNPLATWLWSDGSDAPGLTVVQPERVWVCVTVDGCAAADTVVIGNGCYMTVPNVFTPNGDGLNDYFMSLDYLSKGLVAFQLEIFNRWGTQIFETTSETSRGWDGTYNGTPQPQGVYVYRIHGTFKDGQMESRQGNITLLR